MAERRLKIAIAVSLAVHLGMLGVLGRTSAARPIPVEQLKVVKVELVKEPDEVAVRAPDQERPEKTQVPKPPPQPYVPPVHEMKTDLHPPRPAAKPSTHVVPQSRPSRARPVRVASAKPPGNPGGSLNLGTPSPNGQDLGQVESGKTPVGWVPSPSGGRGAGSGTDPGVGRPEPVPEASHGRGQEPAPRIDSPPPPPRMVQVTVCAVSGERPGPYCERKVTRSYVEGQEPRATCDRCKPEPKHESRLAQAREAERIRDAPVELPESVRDEGLDARVTVTYTVDTDGNVTDVEVSASSGNPAVDRAVVAAARKMKYRPAVQDGIPRSVRMRRTYHIRG